MAFYFDICIIFVIFVKYYGVNQYCFYIARAVLLDFCEYILRLAADPTSPKIKKRSIQDNLPR